MIGCECLSGRAALWHGLSTLMQAPRQGLHSQARLCSSHSLRWMRAECRFLHVGWVTLPACMARCCMRSCTREYCAHSCWVWFRPAAMRRPPLRPPRSSVACCTGAADRARPICADDPRPCAARIPFAVRRCANVAHRTVLASHSGAQAERSGGPRRAALQVLKIEC